MYLHEFDLEKIQWLQDLNQMISLAIEERNKLIKIAKEQPPYSEPYLKVIKLTEGMEKENRDKLISLVSKLSSCYDRLYEVAEKASNHQLNALLQLPSELINHK